MAYKEFKELNIYRPSAALSLGPRPIRAGLNSQPEDLEHMKQIYSIRDRVANELVGHGMYLLFTFKTPQQAVRYFADAIMDEKSILNKHPHDYELLALGALVETAGGEVIQTSGQPEIVITGTALLAAHSPKQEDE